MLESDKKSELILEGAIKRFAHFGINKTSMAEIAEDLSLSKPALYYYYPDKQSLILAVAERIITEYLEKVEQTFPKHSSLDEALMNLIELRRDFFQKYFMLHMEEEYSGAYLKDPAFIKLMQNTKEREVAIIAMGFQRGIDRAEIRKIDTVRTSELLLDTLRGLRACMKNEKVIFPDADSFEEVLSKQKEVARIFLYGIKDYSDGRTNLK